MADDLVLTDLDADHAIGTMTLNNPGVRNATSIALLDAMDAGLDTLTANPGLRALILAGAGPAFCSGLDLDEVRSDRETIHHLLRRLSEVMRRIRRLPAVTIARVQGAAIGGGFGKVLFLQR